MYRRGIGFPFWIFNQRRLMCKKESTQDWWQWNDLSTFSEVFSFTQKITL